MHGDGVHQALEEVRGHDHHLRVDGTRALAVEHDAFGVAAELLDVLLDLVAHKHTPQQWQAAI